MSCRVIASIAFIGAFGLAGCAAPAKVEPTELTLSDFAISGPASLTASMASFNVTNKGKEAHQAALVRLDSNKTYADFQAAMKDTTMHGPPPSWIVWMGGAHAFPGGASQFAVSLEPGNYVWYCLIPGADGVPHMMKGMSAPMTVTAGNGTAAPPPVADIDVTEKDYQWDFSTPIKAGKHTLKVAAAAGSQPHEFVIVKLAEGKSAKDFVDWAMKMAGPPPAESLSGVATLQPGQVNYTTIDFKAGKYALICFLPDAKDGQPHAMHGMIQDLTVQ